MTRDELKNKLAKNPKQCPFCGSIHIDKERESSGRIGTMDSWDCSACSGRWAFEYKERRVIMAEALYEPGT